MRTEEPHARATHGDAVSLEERPRLRRGRAVVSAIGVAVVLGFIATAALRDADEPSRQQVVAERGSTVMPFDLEATTHVFEPTVYGGVQTVVADDPTDDEQIELIRFHLQEEVVRFRAGDFGDPETIHGDEMPGLNVLETRYDALTTTYRERPDGAQVIYRSTDPSVVDALRLWFEAQLSDHGGHAERG